MFKIGDRVQVLDGVNGFRTITDPAMKQGKIVEAREDHYGLGVRFDRQDGDGPLWMAAEELAPLEN